MAEGKIIRPNMQKNFLIARVGVSKNDLKHVDVFIPANYKLYFFAGALNLIRDSDSNQKISGEDIIDKLKVAKFANNFITLYWTLNKTQLNVPWGINVDAINTGYNGSLKFEINDFDKLLASKMFPYATEQRDGLYYEYLSEYFITENKMHAGISIVLRDMFVPLFKDYIKKIIQCPNAQSKVDMIQNGVAVKEYLDELGLKIVDINVTEFYPSTQSKNLGSGDK